MRVVAEQHHLVSLSVSGNPIDTAAAKHVAYALAYNRSLKSISLVHCSIEHEGQRHIAAGIVSNRGIALRKLTGFGLGRKYWSMYLFEFKPSFAALLTFYVVAVHRCYCDDKVSQRHGAVDE